MMEKIIIISWDYADFQEKIPFIEREKIVKAEAKKMLKENIDNSEIYIFWQNIPKTHIKNCNNEYLFYCMCQRIKLSGNNCKVYIDCLSTIAEGSVETLLRRLIMLYAVTPLVPVFLNKEVSQEGISKDKSNTDAFFQYFSFNSSDIQYQKLIEFFKSMSLSTTGKEMFDFSAYKETNFIEEYISWQLGKTPAEKACANLGNMSKATFYKYVTEFEKCPLYPQFLYSYSKELVLTPKKGYLLDDMDLFLKDTSSYDGCIQTIVDEYVVCKKYDLYSPIDVKRLRMAVEKKVESQNKK